MSAPTFEGAPIEQPRIDLTYGGVPEQEWLDALTDVPLITAVSLADATIGCRLVVVSPHPDDETFGVGGLIAEWSASARPTTILSLTDGEAAQIPDDPSPDLRRLAARRRGELTTAVSRLTSLGRIAVVRAGLPDGALADHVGEIEELIAGHSRPGDVVVAPIDCDGHPDHEAAGVAARHVSQGQRTLWYPIWAWHWHDPRHSPIVRSAIRVRVGTAAKGRRAGAIEAYGSQIRGSVPVVPAEMVRRFGRPFDVLIGPHDCGRPIDI